MVSDFFHLSLYLQRPNKERQGNILIDLFRILQIKLLNSLPRQNLPNHLLLPFPILGLKNRLGKLIEPKLHLGQNKLEHGVGINILIPGKKQPNPRKPLTNPNKIKGHPLGLIGIQRLNQVSIAFLVRYEGKHREEVLLQVQV
jgi:hypothetical protein